MSTIINIQNISEGKKQEYLSRVHPFGVMLAFEAGIFGLEDFSLQAIKKVCEQYSALPEREDDPLSFLIETEEMKKSVCEDMIKLKLKSVLPEVYFSLYPMSQRDMDAKYSEMSDIVFIA